MIHVTVQCGDERCEVKPNEPLTIGRAIDNRLRLNKDPMVSRYHCEILIHDNAVTIEDKKSTNGIRVNENVVEGTIGLHDADTFDIGGTRLFLHVYREESGQPVDMHCQDCTVLPRFDANHLASQA